MAAGINVPITPGLKPITTHKQLSVVPHYFHVNLPDKLVDEIEDCKTNEQARQASVKWCIQQSQELIEAGVPVLHYYSMGKARSIKEIAEEVFGS